MGRQKKNYLKKSEKAFMGRQNMNVKNQKSIYGKKEHECKKSEKHLWEERT